MSHLPASALRLLAVLDGLDADLRRHATNVQLADRTGYTTRTVTTALGQLERAGHLRLVWTSPHPTRHTTGRHIMLPGDDR
jgi:DNA-binding MarR family transcriptional regulator